MCTRIKMIAKIRVKYMSRNITKVKSYERKQWYKSKNHKKTFRILTLFATFPAGLLLSFCLSSSSFFSALLPSTLCRFLLVSCNLRVIPIIFPLILRAFHHRLPPTLCRLKQWQDITPLILSVVCSCLHNKACLDLYVRMGAIGMGRSCKSTLYLDLFDLLCFDLLCLLRMISFDYGELSSSCPTWTKPFRPSSTIYISTSLLLCRL